MLSRYLGRGKDESLLNAAAQAYNINPKKDMWKLPPHYVGEYAEKDAELTLKLWQACKHELQIQDVWSMFDLETARHPQYHGQKQYINI